MAEFPDDRALLGNLVVSFRVGIVFFTWRVAAITDPVFDVAVFLTGGGLRFDMGQHMHVHHGHGNGRLRGGVVSRLLCGNRHGRGPRLKQRERAGRGIDRCAVRAFRHRKTQGPDAFRGAVHTGHLSLDRLAGFPGTSADIGRPDGLCGLAGLDFKTSRPGILMHDVALYIIPDIIGPGVRADGKFRTVRGGFRRCVRGVALGVQHDSALGLSVFYKKLCRPVIDRLPGFRSARYRRRLFLVLRYLQRIGDEEEAGLPFFFGIRIRRRTLCLAAGLRRVFRCDEVDELTAHGVPLDVLGGNGVVNRSACSIRIGYLFKVPVPQAQFGGFDFF